MRTRVILDLVLVLRRLWVRTWYVISGRRGRVERAALRIACGLFSNRNFEFEKGDEADFVRLAKAILKEVDRVPS